VNAIRKSPSLIPFLVLATSTALFAQPGTSTANYKQAERFSSEFLRQFVYGGSVTPNWIGDTDQFWYSFKSSEGTHYWLVDPDTRTKTALFDRARLAALLTEACRKPRDAGDLRITGLKIDDEGKKLTFTADKLKFELDRTDGTLKEVKKDDDEEEERSSRSRRGRRGRGSSGSKETAKDIEKRRARAFEQALKKYYDKKKGKDKEEEDNGSSRFRRTSGSAFSPDMQWYAYAEGRNIYVTRRTGDLPPDTEEDKKDAKGSDGKEKVKDKESKSDTQAAKPKGDKEQKKKKTPFPYEAKEVIQLSTDGAEDYSFGGGGEEQKLRTPKTVTWAPDSKGFYVTRSDSREVAELWLVDSLGKPRPTLQKYKYAMPGEENVRRSELYVYRDGKKSLIPVKQKWADEWYSDVKWLESGELRAIRRDRLRRNLEYGVINPDTGDFRPLITEGFDNANQTTQSVRYLEDRGELIWWSERTGWGHYYLYGLDGKLKNPITTGRFRASRIIEVDEEKGLLWFRANGREPGENIYYEHLYRVRLDGTGLTLLDPGNGTHRSSMPKSRRYVVDSYSRVDLPNRSVLRDENGEEIMTLGETDVSRITEMGWTPPTPFKVKAADGITDLYGNMWKPFDFDPAEQYPLIVHVYPGPQAEGVTHTFSATGSRQELAQLGFIVIQVGHRGGTPTRSKAYGAYGYFNMRDYGLKDKKAAIEQLAARHPFIDINRIGIYGHSGGGFMTAAALLQKPYNEFFKVGVSTAGNHDNNVYNNSWSERYHGLKEVEAKKSDGKKTDGKKTDGKKTDGKKTDGKKSDGKKSDGKKSDDKKTDDKKTDDKKTDDKKTDDKKSDDKKSDDKKKRFDIHIPTNAELAANLKGKLLLVHGEIDNNVHPAGTMRLVSALIKANKRFDLLIIPGARHSFGSASTYMKHITWEYFAKHLLGDAQPGADIKEKAPRD